jgi:DNA-binding HxlR family transcriptional regulator
MDSRRIYRHFCMLARTLEVAGDRWSLLIVRDLLLGPLRFTDLIRGLNEITPTRLTGRLRQLEAEGLVTREPPSTGREVWYRLTDAGRDLGPVVEALTLWGIEHRLEPPRPGEPVGAVPVMIGTKVWLSRNAQGRESPVSWVWHFAPDDRFSIWFDLQRAARMMGRAMRPTSRLPPDPPPVPPNERGRPRRRWIAAGALWGRSRRRADDRRRPRSRDRTRCSPRERWISQSAWV